jgi:predicted RNase H-like HicB family nuclease
MGDAPTVIFNQLSEANPLSLDQPISVSQNYFPLPIGHGYFGGGQGMFHRDSFSPSPIYANDPFIFLGIMQFAFEAQQQRWNLTIFSLEDSIRTLTSEMNELKVEIQQLCKTRTFVIPLTTLAPEPFQIVQQIPVTIEGDGEDFTATFTEANVSASGETEADAIANFKESLLSCYEVLEEMPANQLGPLPTRQWSILRSVLRRIE